MFPATKNVSSCWPLPPVVYNAPPPPPFNPGFVMPIWAIVLLVVGSVALTAGIVAGVLVCQRRIKAKRDAEERRILTEAIEGEWAFSSSFLCLSSVLRTEA